MSLQSVSENDSFAAIESAMAQNALGVEEAKKAINAMMAGADSMDQKLNQTMDVAGGLVIDAVGGPLAQTAEIVSAMLGDRSGEKASFKKLVSGGQVTDIGVREIKTKPQSRTAALVDRAKGLGEFNKHSDCTGKVDQQSAAPFFAQLNQCQMALGHANRLKHEKGLMQHRAHQMGLGYGTSQSTPQGSQDVTDVAQIPGVMTFDNNSLLSGPKGPTHVRPEDEASDLA